MGEAVDQLREIIPEATLVSAADITELGDKTGAYALVIELADPVRFSRKALGSTVLQGEMIYAGSANGPGGMRARLNRHFRKEKSIRWHVDELTTCAARISALALPGGRECEIVRRLIASRKFAPAMSGFGSNDCSACTAHLLKPIAGQAASPMPKSESLR